MGGGTIRAPSSLTGYPYIIHVNINSQLYTPSIQVVVHGNVGNAGKLGSGDKVDNGGKLGNAGRSGNRGKVGNASKLQVMVVTKVGNAGKLGSYGGGKVGYAG